MNWPSRPWDNGSGGSGTDNDGGSGANGGSGSTNGDGAGTGDGNGNGDQPGPADRPGDGNGQSSADPETVAAHANAVRQDAMGNKYPDAALAGTIGSSVRLIYTDGTYQTNGGMFAQNNTWYLLIVREGVNGIAYKGVVYDVITVSGDRQGKIDRFALQALGPDGSWQEVQPVQIGMYYYFVLPSWDTSDNTMPCT